MDLIDGDCTDGDLSNIAALLFDSGVSGVLVAMDNGAGKRDLRGPEPRRDGAILILMHFVLFDRGKLLAFDGVENLGFAFGCAAQVFDRSMAEPVPAKPLFNPNVPRLVAFLAIEVSPLQYFIRLEEAEAMVFWGETGLDVFFFGVVSSDLSKSVFERERFSD